MRIYIFIALFACLLSSLLNGCDKIENEKGDETVMPSPNPSPAEKTKIDMYFYLPDKDMEFDKLVMRAIIKSSNVTIINYAYLDKDKNNNYFVLQSEDSTYIFMDEKNSLKVYKYDLKTNRPDSVINMIMINSDNNTYLISKYIYDWENQKGYFDSIEEKAISVKKQAILKDKYEDEIRDYFGDFFDSFAKKCDLYLSLFPNQFAGDVNKIIQKCVLPATKINAGIKIDPIEITKDEYIDLGLEYIVARLGFTRIEKLYHFAYLAFDFLKKDNPTNNDEQAIEEMNSGLFPTFGRASEIPTTPTDYAELKYTVYPKRLSFKPEGSSSPVLIHDVFKWDIKSKPEWCTIEKVNHTFWVDVEKSNISRTGFIVVQLDAPFASGLGSREETIMVTQNAGFDNTCWRIDGVIQTKVNIKFHSKIPIIPDTELPSINMDLKDNANLLLEFGNISKNEVRISPALPDGVEYSIDLISESEIKVNMIYTLMFNPQNYGVPYNITFPAKSEAYIYLKREIDDKSCMGMLNGIISGNFDNQAISCNFTLSQSGDILAILQ